MSLIWLLVGLCIGSFLNGLAFRATSQRNLFSPRSVCAQCESKIAWIDLIPVISWVFLRGKCHYCDRRIPLRYPLIELFVGIISFIYFKDVHLSSLIIIQYVFILSFLLNALTDATNFSVYNPFLYFMVACSLVLVFLRGEILSGILLGSIWVIIIAIISFIVGVIVKKQAMGSGDYFVFFVLGMILSPNSMLDVLLLSSSFGIVMALIFRKKSLPFFPLLFFGYIVVFMGVTLI